MSVLHSTVTSLAVTRSRQIKSVCCASVIASYQCPLHKPAALRDRVISRYSKSTYMQIGSESRVVGDFANLGSPTVDFRSRNLNVEWQYR